MKTSELIKLLLKTDPNDECIVCIGNHPVNDIDLLPYYYDGRLEYIERDAGGTPIRVGYKAGGFKIKIYYDSIEDALMDNPDAKLELSGVTYEGKVNERHMDFINACIRDGREYQEYHRQLVEARANGKEFDSLPIKRLSFKDKMLKFLKLIK